MKPWLGTAIVFVGCGANPVGRASAPAMDEPVASSRHRGDSSKPPALPPKRVLEQKSLYWQRLATFLNSGRVYEGEVGRCVAWDVRILNKGERWISGSLLRSYREESARVDVIRKFSASPDRVVIHGRESEWDYDVDAPPGEKVLGAIQPCISTAKITAGHRDFVRIGSGKHSHIWYISEEVCRRYEAVTPSGDGC